VTDVTTGPMTSGHVTSDSTNTSHPHLKC
jgi:hypothetical protein